MKPIMKSYTIKASVEDVWNALVDPAIINKWGAGKAEMSDHAGSKFSLWDGDIHGTNVEVVEQEKLVQDWYSGDWPEPSKVTFTLSEDDGRTTIDLTHENVPEEDADDIDEGWDLYYLGAMKKYLEKK